MALVNNQMALNSVYNYYLTTYAPTTRESSRYDTHKKSELRSVYNSIVKQTKDSPLYIVDRSRESQAFAVGMKENARQFSNAVSELSYQDSGDILGRKAASSSNKNLVDAQFIGDSSDVDDSLTFDISVSKLATTQLNKGRFLASDSKVKLDPDTYSFDIFVNDTDYEFQFNIGSADTNLDIQNKLAALINRSNIGIKATVDRTQDGYSSLDIESTSTGLEPDKDMLFSISDDHTGRLSGSVDYLGIDNIYSPATNAEFVLNGTERMAYSNSFTVDKKFEINLLSVTGDESVSIGIKPDVESMSENITQLIDHYNTFIHKIGAYSGKKLRTDSLISDIQRANREYVSELKDMGLTFDNDNAIEIDTEKLNESLGSNESSDHVSTIKNYTQALMRKSRQISLNPMNYVEKTIVAYKNPGKSFTNPYVTSLYSGMMFNSYC